MKLKTLNILMKEDGHEIEVKFKVRYQPENKPELNIPWMLRCSYLAQGVKYVDITVAREFAGVNLSPAPRRMAIPEIKSGNLLADKPMFIPDSVHVTDEATHTFTARIQATDIVVEENDVYQFICDLVPAIEITPSNKRVAYKTEDINI